MSPGSRKGGGRTGKSEALLPSLLCRSWESCEGNLCSLVSISLSELSEPTVMLLSSLKTELNFNSCPINR